MRFHHSFRVELPSKIVSRFHFQSASMGAITPPPVIVQIHKAPQLLHEGGEMDFTLWLGPFPIHWLARIEDVSEGGFTDRQLQGPFKIWKHNHRFIPINSHKTEVIDDIQFEFKSHPFWFFIGFVFASSLPFLFIYRRWKTRQILMKDSRRL